MIVIQPGKKVLLLWAWIFITLFTQFLHFIVSSAGRFLSTPSHFIYLSKRPLGRPRGIWEDNIKMGLREIGIDGANWIRVAQDRVQLRAFVSTVMNLRVP